MHKHVFLSLIFFTSLFSSENGFLEFVRKNTKIDTFNRPYILGFTVYVGARLLFPALDDEEKAIWVAYPLVGTALAMQVGGILLQLYKDREKSRTKIANHFLGRLMITGMMMAVCCYAYKFVQKKRETL